MDKKQVVIDWLKRKRIKFSNTTEDGTFGVADIYAKETKRKSWQFDLYEDHMDIYLSCWDKDHEMEDSTELYNIPFTSSPEQLDSLMKLTGY